MIDLEHMLAQPLVEALGWGLIHFIWQGTLVALLLAGVLRMLRGASANARYATACAALLLMLLAPPATMAIIISSEPGKTANRLSPETAPLPGSRPMAVEIEPAGNLAQTAAVTASPRPWSFVWSVNLVSLLPWMILLWLVGVVCFSLRLIGGWLYTRRLRRYGTRSLEETWRQALNQLCRQLRVTRPVRLLESALVKVPMVIGWLRPVILLPIGALTGLTTRQLESIIAHELAHIRRHDYLINLLQSLIETLLFYHPAVWWVSRRIRREREHCCDDLAVAVCGDALTYARALLEMEQLRAAGPQLAMAANGGSLMYRIQRLVGAQTQHTDRFTGLFAGVIALTTVISVGTAAQILLRSSDQQVASVLKREARQVKTSDETSGEPNSVNPSQPIDSAQEDRAAEALGLLKQSAGESSIGAMRKQFGEEAAVAPEQTAELQAEAAENLKALSSSDPMRRAIAACSLGRLGAVEAIPALINMLGDDTPIRPIKCWDSGNWSPARHKFKQAAPGEQAAIALASLSQHAVAPLIAALSNGSPGVRRNAAWAIGEVRGGLGTDRSAAVEPLIVALIDEDAWVRMAAAFSLGEMRPREATESLIAALGDAEWRVREMAVRALGEMKSHAGVEILTSLSLRDENERVRRKAAWALGEIKEAPAQESTAQRSRNLKFAGRLTNATRTLEWNLTDPRELKMARLKIDGQIKSGSSVWTLRDPNGKSVFTAESDKAELSLDSGALNVIPGTWTLQAEFKNSTLDFEVHWSAR